MAEVFISYHERSAGGLAAQIADALEAGGITCWYAKRDIPTGGDFARAIPTQIDACKVFLLVLTKDAQTSKHIESEVGLAFSRANRGEDITIFPVEIGDFEKESWIRYYLVHAQILKCAVLDAERMQELTRRVAKRLNRELKPPAKIIKRGKWGDNVTYALDENGILTISGKGAMRDFERNKEIITDDIPWWNERKIISHVEIQNGVTSIGEYVFNQCTGLTSVTIPDSVTSIEDFAFADCTGLTSVTIPDSVISIENGVFFGCTGLVSVTISNSVTSIGDFAFCDCMGLTSITIPNSVTVIGDWAFCHCKGLTNVTIPDSVTYIGVEAFADCWGLTNVSVPAKAKIAPKAFPDGVL